MSRGAFVGGAAALSAALSSPGALWAAQRTPASASKLNDIDHIILFMQENRSFDHYFGMLRGVRGFNDAHAATLSDGRSVFYQPDAVNPDGYTLPFHLDTKRTSAQCLSDLSHAWGAQHASWNDGKLNAWLPAHRKADGKNGPLTMGHYTRSDLPFYYALADEFTICDGYHCSVMGPTNPNRYYFWTATIDPNNTYGAGPAIDNSGTHYSWETYPERLERAGISWRIYHEKDDFDDNIVKFFRQFQGLPATSPLYENAIRDRTLDEMLEDFRSGNIPQVTWIVAPTALSEHPDYLPAAGADYTGKILSALMSNEKIWSKCAFILNYDENDGLFDHVAPPVPEPGTANEYVNGVPIGLGFRVPATIVSPFSRGGYVCGETFDHTSTLRLIERRFGVEVANLSQWRRATCGDLTSAFGFGEPPRFDIPRLPATQEAAEAAERECRTLPRPKPPRDQAMPSQEPGTRPRR